MSWRKQKENKRKTKMKYKLIDRYNILSSASQKVTPEGRPVSNFTAWIESKPIDYQVEKGWLELDLSAPHPFDSEAESGDDIGETGTLLTEIYSGIGENNTTIKDYNAGVKSVLAKNYIQAYEIVNNVIVMSWEEYEVPIQVFNMLKTLLRENMREAGIESVLDNYLETDATAKKKWDECVVLESNSPFITNAISTIVGAGIKTEEEMKEIMEKSRTTLTV